MVATPAGAQSARCSSLCAPTLSVAPAMMVSHLLGHPRVQSLDDGSTRSLGSLTNLDVAFTIAAPTAIPRTKLFATVSWLPTAHARANPFTEYTASQLGGDDVRANLPSVSLGFQVAALTPKQTGGWVGLTPYVADQFSKAASPTSGSDYSHKLELGLTSTINLFSRMPSSSWLHGLAAFATFDWVATGLPGTGDEVPKGERVFLDHADGTALILGASAQVAPLAHQ
jgi:hypothetical protein